MTSLSLFAYLVDQSFNLHCHRHQQWVRRVLSVSSSFAPQDPCMPPAATPPPIDTTASPSLSNTTTAQHFRGTALDDNFGLAVSRHGSPSDAAVSCVIPGCPGMPMHASNEEVDVPSDDVHNALQKAARSVLHFEFVVV